MRRSFTLIEIIVVIIIIGVLSTLGFTHYAGIREKVLDKEAVANLKLLQAAERIYRMEQGSSYYPPGGSEGNITLINTNLKLSLPAGDNRSWNYVVWGTDGCVQATRRLASPQNRLWRLMQLEEEPIKDFCVSPI